MKNNQLLHKSHIIFPAVATYTQQKDP